MKIRSFPLDTIRAADELVNCLKEAFTGPLGTRSSDFRIFRDVFGSLEFLKAVVSFSALTHLPEKSERRIRHLLIIRQMTGEAI